jgi:hypothetical protein
MTKLSSFVTEILSIPAKLGSPVIRVRRTAATRSGITVRLARLFIDSSINHCYSLEYEMNKDRCSHFAARAVILAGLLAGLLFSSGEGVHLFPFPSAEAAQNLNPRADGGEKIQYQKNAPRVEKNQQKYESRLKDGQDASAAGHSFRNEPRLERLSAAQLHGHFHQPHLLRSQLFAIPIRGRAPPIT